MLIKSGPIVKGVKDVLFETNEIVSLRHMGMSFYYWKVFICVLWYSYWYQVFCGGAGARGRLRSLSLNAISNGVGNFKIQSGISKLIINFSPY